MKTAQTNGDTIDKRVVPSDERFKTVFKSPLTVPASKAVASTSTLPVKRSIHFEENVNTTFKNPLQTSSNLKKRKCRDAKENDKAKKTLKPRVVNNADHEDLIARLLSKPFKVPIPDYVSDGHGNRSLGVKRSIVRRALHDPFACNALVLYTPPPEAADDPKKLDKSKVLVHVVVDPVVGNILRPHQRAGVQFMYECVTGAKGEFCGCIMADEVIFSRICDQINTHIFFLLIFFFIYLYLFIYSFYIIVLVHCRWD